MFYDRLNLSSSNFAGGLMAVASSVNLCALSCSSSAATAFRQAGGMLLAQGISSLQQQQLQLQQQQD